MVLCPPADCNKELHDERDSYGYERVLLPCDKGIVSNVTLRHNKCLITDITQGHAPADGRRALVIPALVS
jgi:hypothetical protein